MKNTWGPVKFDEVPTVKAYEIAYQTMGDTKRGRERKGEKKREQRREKDISASLGADDEPPEPEETPPEITDPDLEHVSVTTADEQEDEDEIE